MDQQEIFKIWMAGFYEGEGCICNDKSNGNRMRLSIAQNDPTPLKKAQEIWGGSLSKRVRKSPASDKICVGYEWRLGHADAEAFFHDVERYFQIPQKIRQLEKSRELAGKKMLKRWNCPQCSSTFANPAAKRRHVNTQHTNKGKKYPCSLCKRVYASQGTLSRHLHTNHIHTDASSEEEKTSEQEGL